jgi:UDP-glucuronate decarboxylase
MPTNLVVNEDLEYIHQIVGQRKEWKEATIIVTGCAGFLGYYIMLYLVRYADKLSLKKIIGLDNFMLGKPPWLEQLARAHQGILDLITFDISRDRLDQVAGADQASYVIHGASVASPTFYRQYPLETIDANIWGLRNLLEYYRGSTSLRGLLFFSSSEIYGDPGPTDIPTAEAYRGYVSCVGPRACYDESKRFGETLCYVFSRHYNLPITIARPFNNFGPGMRLEDLRLPADFARCVLEQRDIIILSDGTPTRTFCYVADAVAGYLLCLLYPSFDIFNIGTESPEISVREFGRIYQAAAKELFLYDGDVVYQQSTDSDYLVDNPNRRCPVISKAREKLGYNPMISVEEGVRRYLRHIHTEHRSS